MVGNSKVSDAFRGIEMSELSGDMKAIRKRLERETRQALKDAGCDMPPSEMTADQKRAYEAITRKFRRAMARASEVAYKVPPERAKFDELIGRAAVVFLSQNPDHRDAVANIAALLVSDPSVAAVIKRRLDARLKEVGGEIVRRKVADERAASRTVAPGYGAARSDIATGASI